MHLGIVRLKYTPFGGAERIIQRLVSSLGSNSRVGRITIFSSHWASNKEAEGNVGVDVDVDVDVVKIKPKGVGRFWRQRDFFNAASQAINAIKTLDIVQSHERLVGSDIFRTGDGVHAAWLDRLSRDRDWLGRQLLQADPFHRLICANETKMASDPRTVFVANSPLAKVETERYLGVPENRIWLIPNGIDAEHWKNIPRDSVSRAIARGRLGLDTNNPCVLFVGSGFQRKGLRELILAVAPIENVQLLVVGKDSKASHYRQFADQKAPGRVRFAGPLESVEDAITAADVFCLPSLYDSFSNAALEALGAGLPAVISQDTGLASYVETHGGGLVCKRDPENIRESLELALNRADTLSAEAIELAKEFDHSVITPRWLELYQSVLERKNAL
jgi:UDP-glucose:(heptosyl)LPS alpha-1,3-glucosyltransferase